ncbi:hypothetical protein EJB05_33993 [Eragrostis curvula]|uniref:Uncharacterized protein n=1 Tax=Eragrostis curvula TaxID=38414 RepID=A0A5J9U4A4_9POAL|nr:hypothetical protein EJB05_33993 [Eragrostis curvula]
MNTQKEARWVKSSLRNIKEKLIRNVSIPHEKKAELENSLPVRESSMTNVEGCIIEEAASRNDLNATPFTLHTGPTTLSAGTNPTLGAWLIWKHRNSGVFDGASPSISNIIPAFNDEHHLWCLAGTRALRALDVGRVIE